MVVDMPFGTYQSDSNNALKSAVRIMKETGGHAVKLEGERGATSRQEDHRRRDSRDGASGAHPPVHLQIRDLQRQGETRRRRRSG